MSGLHSSHPSVHSDEEEAPGIIESRTPESTIEAVQKDSTSATVVPCKPSELSKLLSHLVSIVDPQNQDQDAFGELQKVSSRPDSHASYCEFARMLRERRNTLISRRDPTYSASPERLPSADLDDWEQISRADMTE
jgi:hypothetical protein